MSLYRILYPSTEGRDIFDSSAALSFSLRYTHWSFRHFRYKFLSFTSISAIADSIGDFTIHTRFNTFYETSFRHFRLPQHVRAKTKVQARRQKDSPNWSRIARQIQDSSQHYWRPSSGITDSFADSRTFHSDWTIHPRTTRRISKGPRRRFPLVC
jgi:hypothetical protein